MTMKEFVFSDRGILSISMVLIVAIFFLDASTPSGYSACFLYILPLFFCLGLPNDRTVYAVALIATILTIATMTGLRSWLQSNGEVEISSVPGSFADSRRLLATSVNNRLLSHPLVALAAAVYKGRRNNRPQLLKLVASLAAGEDAVTLRDLARIPHETLVLWGDRDRIFPLATGRAMCRALPHARLEVLPRCGHVPPTERPVAFARRVTAFLDA